MLLLHVVQYEYLHVQELHYYRYHAGEDEEYTQDGVLNPSQHGSRVRTYPSRKVLIHTWWLYNWNTSWVLFTRGCDVLCKAGSVVGLASVTLQNISYVCEKLYLRGLHWRQFAEIHRLLHVANCKQTMACPWREIWTLSIDRRQTQHTALFTDVMRHGM